MLEENQLRYIRWEQCTKRDQELLGIRHDPLWKPGADGVVREVRQKEEALADTSSDLHLKYCLQRRSLALDQARIIDYEKMERWSRTMLEAYSALPIDGYKKVSLDQIQRADLELFKFLMKHSREGIRPSGGVAPLEAILDRAITSAEIRLRLAPLPAGSGSGIKRKHDDLEPETANKAKHSPDDIAKLKRTIENLWASSQFEKSWIVETATNRQGKQRPGSWKQRLDGSLLQVYGENAPRACWAVSHDRSGRANLLQLQFGWLYRGGPWTALPKRMAHVHSSWMSGSALSAQSQVIFTWLLCAIREGAR